MANLNRFLTLTERTPRTVENLQLGLGLLLEPHRGILSTSTVGQVLDVRGLDGVSLHRAVPPVFYPGTSGISLMGWTNLQLNGPNRRNDRIKVLKGVLPVEVMAWRQDLVTVPDLTAARGQTFHGPQGHRLTVVAMSTPRAGRPVVQYRLSGPPGWRPGNQEGVEVIDSRGHSQYYVLPPPVASLLSEPLPEDLAWLATTPQATSLLQVPWPALARLRPASERLEWRGILPLSLPTPLEGPVQLRLYRFERVRVEVPFELHDVPLP